MGTMKILSCFIKPWEIPRGELFLPIQGGKTISDIDLGILGDDTGDQISAKNKTFGEFTAWYWAWKNIKKLYPDLEYIGLAHYRHYFAMDRYSITEAIYTPHVPDMDGYEQFFRRELKKKDIILVKKITFPYSVEVQYSFGHNHFDLLTLKEIMHEMCPEYDESFRTVIENNNRISFWCLFVARYELFDAYFSWLFPLLFEAERRIDPSNYPLFQQRVFAFLAERLLDVYVFHNNLSASYKPIYFIGAPPPNSTKKVVRKAIRFFVPYGIIQLYRNRKSYTNALKRKR